MRTRAILITLLFLLVTSTFALPEVNEYKYKKVISYNSINNMEGYLINHYNDKNQKIKQEVYDRKDNLIRYKIYKYNSLGLLIKETWVSSKGWIKNIKIIYKGNLLSKRIIQYPKKDTIYVKYSYAYYKDRIIYKLATYYNIDKYSITKNFFTKKTFSTLRANGIEFKEYYVKSNKSSNKKFYFESGEVYQHNFLKKIKAIIYLDSNKKIVKYASYIYDKKNNIKRINIYKTKGKELAWNEIARLTRNNLKPKNTILFYYKTDDFPRDKITIDYRLDKDEIKELQKLKDEYANKMEELEKRKKELGEKKEKSRKELEKEPLDRDIEKEPLDRDIEKEPLDKDIEKYTDEEYDEKYDFTT